MNRIFLYCSALFFLSSCNQFLETTPKDFISPENFYKTEEQADQALNGLYSAMTSNYTYASNMLGRMALDGDESYDNYSADQHTISDNNFGANESMLLSYWREWYAGINRANMFLENIDGAQMDEQKKVNMKGQALFLRGYFYLMLVNRFGDIPLIMNSIKSGDSESIQVPQTPAREVYEQILRDMEEAADMVDDAATVGYGGRISKSAVWGVLARTCLYMAGEPINDRTKYEQARSWAKKVMDTGTHDLNPSFPQVFINHVQDIYDIKESIWEIEFWGNGTGLYDHLSGYVGRNNGIGNTQDPNYGYSAGMVRATRPLYNKFDPNDLRRDWALAPFRYVGNPATIEDWPASQIYQRYCGKWRRVYELVLPRSTLRTPTNFPLLRYSDVLLMFAEADNEVNNGPTYDAYEAVNQVRRRGYGKAIHQPDAEVDLQNLSKQEFLEEIQDERSRELAFECLRKSDLIRWGIYLRNMQFVYQDVGSQEGALYDNVRRAFGSVTQRHLLWPIPSYELGLNTRLVQNPGW